MQREAGHRDLVVAGASRVPGERRRKHRHQRQHGRAGRTGARHRGAGQHRQDQRHPRLDRQRLALRDRQREAFHRGQAHPRQRLAQQVGDGEHQQRQRRDRPAPRTAGGQAQQPVPLRRDGTPVAGQQKRRAQTQPDAQRAQHLHHQRGHRQRPVGQQPRVGQAGDRGRVQAVPVLQRHRQHPQRRDTDHDRDPPPRRPHHDGRRVARHRPGAHRRPARRRVQHQPAPAPTVTAAAEPPHSHPAPSPSPAPAATGRAETGGPALGS